MKNGGKYYIAERFILHESYNNPQYAHDIALIQVKETIDFNDMVQPIEVLRFFEEVPDDADLQLTGNDQYSEIKRERVRRYRINVCLFVFVFYFSKLTGWGKVVSTIGCWRLNGSALQLANIFLVNIKFLTCKCFYRRVAVHHNCYRSST